MNNPFAKKVVHDIVWVCPWLGYQLMSIPAQSFYDVYGSRTGYEPSNSHVKVWFKPREGERFAVTRRESIGEARKVIRKLRKRGPLAVAQMGPL